MHHGQRGRENSTPWSQKRCSGPHQIPLLTGFSPCRKSTRRCVCEAYHREWGLSVCGVHVQWGMPEHQNKWTGVHNNLTDVGHYSRHSALVVGTHLNCTHDTCWQEGHKSHSVKGIQTQGSNSHRTCTDRHHRERRRREHGGREGYSLHVAKRGCECPRSSPCKTLATTGRPMLGHPTNSFAHERNPCPDPQTGCH